MTESLEPLPNRKSSKKRRNLRNRVHLVTNTSADGEPEGKLPDSASYILRNCASEGSISSDREEFIEIACSKAPHLDGRIVPLTSSNIPGVSAPKIVVSSRSGSAFTPSRVNNHCPRLRRSDSEESMTAVALSRLTLRTGAQLPVESDSFHESSTPMKPASRRRRKQKRMLVDKDQPPSPSSSLLVNTSECDSWHQVYEIPDCVKDILDESSSCDSTIKRHAQKERKVASLSTSSTISGSSMAGVWRPASSPFAGRKLKSNNCAHAPYSEFAEWSTDGKLSKSSIPSGSKRKSSSSVNYVPNCSNMSPVISLNSQEFTQNSIHMSDYDHYCLMLGEKDGYSSSQSEAMAHMEDDDLMETNLSSHSSLSDSKSVNSDDLGAVTDRGLEGDDEQSDFFHESGGGPTFGVVPWWHISYSKKFKNLTPDESCPSNKTCLSLKKRRKDTQHWVTLQRYWSMCEKNNGTFKSRCEVFNKRRNRPYKTGCRRLLGKSRQQLDSSNSSNLVSSIPDPLSANDDPLALNARPTSDLTTTTCADPSVTPTPEQNNYMEEMTLTSELLPAEDGCKRQKRTSNNNN